MKLRTRLNLVLIGLTAVSVGVLIVDELHDMRSSIREEIEAANRVAAHLLGSLALTDSSADGLAAVREQLQKLGHVRANDITLRTASGEVLYRAPPPVYKAGREAPAWFARLLPPAPAGRGRWRTRCRRRARRAMRARGSRSAASWRCSSSRAWRRSAA